MLCVEYLEGERSEKERKNAEEKMLPVEGGRIAF